jgi:hypothetical protein
LLEEMAGAQGFQIPKKRFEGGNMKSQGSRFLIAVVAFALVPLAWAQAQQAIKVADHRAQKMVLTSSTFSDGGTIPLSAVWNQRSAYRGGGNQSPHLPWTGAPRKTRSFIVVMYDVTATFTHWCMYNIAATATSLPDNAGATGSTLAYSCVESGEPSLCFQGLRAGPYATDAADVRQFPSGRRAALSGDDRGRME